MIAFRRSTVLMFAILVVQAGCVSHVPMSELAMFKGQSERALSPRGTAFGFVAGTDLTSSDDLRENVEAERVIDESGSVDAINGNRRGVGAYFVRKPRNLETAFSGSLGLGIAGIDVTAQVGKNLYATAAASAFGGVEVVLQRPIVDSPASGLAVGIGYRGEWHAFDVCPSTLGGGCGQVFPELAARFLHVPEVRATGLIRESGGGLGLKWNVSAGYAPQFQRPVVNAGLSVLAF